jgi:hypothetical protein
MFLIFTTEDAEYAETHVCTAFEIIQDPQERIPQGS